MPTFSLRPFALAGLIASAGCQSTPTDLRITEIPPEQAAHLADSINATVTPRLADGLKLTLWATDSLVADPIALDIDDQGNVYYTRTSRRKQSEFDIRAHQDWEIPSLKMQTVEDRRTFLRATLTPQNSDQHEWITDFNKDGHRDWRDLTLHKESVYRVEDASGDGIADRSQLVVHDFNDEVTDVAGAVLSHEDELFVGVAPNLWRTIDRNGDGLADKVTSISQGYAVHIGFGGHGMSGLEMGPDGRLYWGIGDIGFNGTGPDGTEWKYPNRGVLVRANPDGSDFEVFAMGLRNVHEFAFDEYGNLIGQDNDGDHQGESERLVYLVDGSDTGWRINWQFGKYRDPNNNQYKVWMDEKLHVPRWDGQAAYIIPPIANFVNGPTGFLYNPGTALGPAWKNHFFVASFVGNPAQSGIHSFKLTPQGATFALGEHEEILGGILATGMDFGPDGAMYLGDWVDGWRPANNGRIWKLDVADGATTDARRQTQTLLGEDFSEQRDEQLGEWLRHPDQRVRQKAQFALVKRGEAGANILEQATAQRDHQLARVHGIWGLSQLARQAAHYARPLVPLLTDDDPEIRAQAARWLGDVRYTKAGDALLPLLKDDYSRARFFAAEALGRLRYEAAIAPIIALLETNNDEDAYLRHAGSLALARIGKPRPVVALSTHPSRAVRLAAVVAMRRMQDPGIVAFLNDEEELVVTEAARAINDDFSIEKALPALGNLLPTTSFQNEALLRRAIGANLRVGTQRALQNLLDYLGRTEQPIAMRAEALEALSTWSEPSVLDRVTGRYRRAIKRAPEPVVKQAGPLLTELTQHPTVDLRRGAVRALGKLNATSAAPTLLARLKQDTDPSVREAALIALVQVGGASTGAALEQALSDSKQQVRATALDLLAEAGLPAPQMVSLLSDVLQTRTIEEQQAALLTLSGLPIEHTRPVLERLLHEWEEGQLPSGVQLELADAIDSTRSSDLQDRLTQVRNQRSGSALADTYQDCLYGGDPARGSMVIFQNAAAQCMQCHAYDDYGGNAGPRLNGVGSRLTREQLLEALVNPSARLAHGYGTVTVEMNDGRTLTGILQDEDDTQLTLKAGRQDDQVLLKQDIAQRTNTPSSMPNMKNFLTKKEIRDLVSFLTTLKEEDT